MKAFVKINEKSGLIVTPSSNNSEYGYVILSQSVSTVNDQGFIATSKRSCLIRGKIADLNAMGLKKDAPFPIDGKIIVVESTTPEYEGQNPKINPETSEVLTHGGAPIYRNTKFTADISKSDILLAHDKDGVVASINVVEAGNDEAAF